MSAPHENTAPSPRIPAWLAEALTMHPPAPYGVDDDAPLAAGDIRRLNPVPGDTHSEPMLVLLADAPTPYDLPGDVTDRPGPCRIVHVLPVGSPHSDATDRDVLIPTTLSGTPFGMYAIVDLFTTIRLDLTDPTGRSRFGPKIGRSLPAALARTGWTATTLDTARLAARMRDTFGLSMGTITPQPGDHAWNTRIRECRNVQRLTDWW